MWIRVISLFIGFCCIIYTILDPFQYAWLDVVTGVIFFSIFLYLSYESHFQLDYKKFRNNFISVYLNLITLYRILRNAEDEIANETITDLTKRKNHQAF